MHKTASYFFILLYILAMTRPVMPLFEYIVNEDYIIEFLCINKDKPELNCNGKCYLMQQLEKQQQQKKENLPKIAMDKYPIGFVFIVLIEPIINYSYLQKRNKTPQNLYKYQSLLTSFHPPDGVI